MTAHKIFYTLEKSSGGSSATHDDSTIHLAGSSAWFDCRMQKSVDEECWKLAHGYYERRFCYKIRN